MKDRIGTEAPAKLPIQPGLAEAIRYLSRLSEACRPATRPSAESSRREASNLTDELATVVRMAVPDFADLGWIEVLDADGATQRIAKFSRDPWIAQADGAAWAHQPVASHCIRVPLHDGLTLLGTLQFVRLPTSKPFSDDESLDGKVLATRIASRITRSKAFEQAPGGCQEVLVDGRLHRVCAILAHELRNPLSVFRTAVDLMASDSESERRLRRILEKQVQRMTHLVDDLLDMSRNMRGKTQLQRQPMPLRPMLESAVQSMEPTLAARNQPIELSIDSDSVWLDADEFRISQILINLLSNASKFSQDGKPIRLAIRRDDPHVEIRVIDEGIGIPAEDLPSVFDFFTQSKSARVLDHSHGGLGIGLGLVKSLVEMHDGTVEALSDGDGHGSEFVVRLPICDAQAVPAKVERPPEESATHRVLVVDDRLDNAVMLQALISKLGTHETRSASDGAGALAALADFRPDLILLDLGLPGSSGLELAQQIRGLDHCRETCMVALTGFDDDSMRAQAEACGIDAYRLKPASLEMLREVFQHPKLCGPCEPS